MTDASREIDAIIGAMHDWRGQTLARLRELITAADTSLVEEVKWKKPSRPEGVPVWSHDGIVCIGEALKSSVRLTFPKGALVDDANGLFNARLDSKSNRAIDFRDGEPVNEAALRALVLGAARLNSTKAAER